MLWEKMARKGALGAPRPLAFHLGTQSCCSERPSNSTQGTDEKCSVRVSLRRGVKKKKTKEGQNTTRATGAIRTDDDWCGP